jgi:serine/threonine protein kinase
VPVLWEMGNGESRGTELEIVFPSSGKMTTQTLLAEGGFGFVYEAVNESGVRFALKQMVVPDTDDNRIKYCKREISILNHLPPCRNIIRYVDSIRIHHKDLKQRHYFLLTELCRCHLWRYMTETNGFHSEERVLFIFSQVCNAVRHLHRQNPPIAHRDIKIENLLVGFDSRIKLCDFGSCDWHHRVPPESMRDQEWLQLEEDIESRVSLAVRAPEQLDLFSQRPLNEKVDLWALGVLLFLLSTARHPFAVPSTGVIEKLGIINCRYHFPSSWPHSVGLQSLIKRILVADPTTRPSIFDILLLGQQLKAEGALSLWPEAQYGD